MIFDENYPTRRLLNIIGDKWTPIVIYILESGIKRYSEIQKQLPDVSKKMLTQTLRALEVNGLLTRTVYPEVPPKVEYQLTDLGRMFLEPVTSLCRWSIGHTSELEAVMKNRDRAGMSD